MHDRKRYTWRFYLILFGLMVFGGILLGRLIYLNLIDRHFLLKQSEARIMRRVVIPATRGMITDRLGDPVAISTPVKSIWVNPKIFKANWRQVDAMAKLLHISPRVIRRRARASSGREFVYLKRRISPVIAKKIAALKIQGVFAQREYKRFYPEGAVAAHVVGLTNIQDQGQEGLELAYNKWLKGTPGAKEVVKDRLGHVIEDVALLKKAQQGHELVLSIDHRIQYLAYRALKVAVEKYHAKAGSVVVLNAKTGEILAMVNLPSYNPNLRPKDHDGRYRNRAVTDIFEPGSVMKPFTIALALESGKYTPDSIVNTNPGWMMVGGYKIKDDGLNYGKINLTQILQKSSNVGAAKIMLSLSPTNYYHLLRKFGFGQRTKSGFPGEADGTLQMRSVWYSSVVAALAYGYGIAVTELQLAHAYQVLANNGIKVPVTFLKRNKPVKGVRVISVKDAHIILNMLRTVVEKGGTGTRAAVPGYHVSGKTGTAYIAGPNGYYKNRFVSSFVGVAPTSDPQLVVAISVRDPQGQHFGGIIAAPVFAKVMGGALRILDIAPDNLSSQSVKSPRS